MKKTALLIMVVTLISKFVGFGREIVLSYYFGASNITDAYLVSQTIPTFIIDIVGIGIVTAYIPVLIEIFQKEGKNRAINFTQNFTNIVLLNLFIFFLLGICFSGYLVALFAKGFDEKTFKLALSFTKISFLSIFFKDLTIIYGGYLQTRKQFVVPALVGIPLNVAIIISIIFASKGNVYLLIYGTVVGTVLQFSFLLPSLKKEGYRHKLFINFKDKYIMKVLYLALPVIIGTSANQINILVDRTIASTLAIGGISALNYANRLNLFVQGIFVTSIVTVLYPIISSCAAQNNLEGIKKSLRESINLIALLVIPLTVGSLLFSKQIIILLFGHGAFGEDAVMMTSTALYFYAFGMLGFALREVLARVFYSLQDSKTPMINAAIGVSMNIVLNIVLSRYMGLGGLALATSISATFTTFLLFVSLRKKMGFLGFLSIGKNLLKICFSAGVMGLAANLIYKCFTISLGANVSLVLSVWAGVLIYFGIIYFMGIEDFDVVVLEVKKRLNKFQI